MARAVKDAKLDNPTARRSLTARDKAYWRLIEAGFHLGYRKGVRGGRWQARIYFDGRYIEKSLGAADDSADAGGVAVLSWSQALAAGRAWRETAMRQALGGEPIVAKYTVADAVEDYTLDYVRRGGKAEVDLRRACRRHILPALGHIEVARLTRRKIRDWHAALAAALPVDRTGKAVEGPMNERARKASANRLFTNLRAALNFAFRENLVSSDIAWRQVKAFEKVDKATIRYLTTDEQRRLVNASDPDFRALVRAALFTGCRYGELCRLVASDIDLVSRTLWVQVSKSGYPRHVTLTDEAVEFFSVLLAGKKAGDLALTKNGRAWSRSDQSGPMAAACLRARLEPRPRFHDLRHSHGSALAMAGVPLNVIAAQLGHLDTTTTERHYAHLAPSYIAETIRANFPVLGIASSSNVVSITQGAK